MVVRNAERFLTESIESVLAQTFRDFEFIIVDFGSTDNSKAIVSSYAAEDSRIHLHEIPNCGLADARNAGCSRARGKYIAVMDADDVCLPARLALEVDFMEKNPQVGVMGGATEWIDGAGGSLGIRSFPVDDRDIKSTLLTSFPFCHPTMLVRAEAFCQVGGYRTPFVFAQDYDLGLRISERFACANLSEVVLKYRIHPSQVSLRKQTQQTLCKLAAQASAASRKNGADALDGITEITPEVLTKLGVTPARQQSTIASDCRNWIRSMCTAGEYSVALDAASGILHSDRKYVERWQIADLYLTMAWLYWKQKRHVKSMLSVLRAFFIRPVILGRSFRPLLQRLGLL
jgi:glycosyltransferase involved in cell wall biosynthesis